MAEYIERDKVLSHKWKVRSYDPSDPDPVTEVVSVSSIMCIPSADVVEVRHGRWIKDDETGEPICSVCYSGKPTRAVCSSVIEHKLNNHEIRYCYYCGAKMDGGQGDV